MPDSSHGRARDLEAFTDPATAFARVVELYDTATAAVRGRVAALVAGDPQAAGGAPACYPYVGIEVAQHAFEECQHVSPV